MKFLQVLFTTQNYLILLNICSEEFIAEIMIGLKYFGYN